MNKIELKRLGSYFEVDEDGFLINPTSFEKIQPDFKPIIDDIVDIYKKLYGVNLKSVYIRGSVAEGQAIKGLSDVDTFAYVDLPKEELDKIDINSASDKIINKYDFIKGLEIEGCPLSDIKDDHILLNQSLCVYGLPVDFPKMKVDKGLARHAPYFKKRIKWFLDFLDNENNPDEILNGCIWFMKLVLRVGFEITIERSKKYTRDLYLCYETFSLYYPEKEKEMREVLDLAINPTKDKEEIKRVVFGIGFWLEKEVDKYF